MKRDKMLRILLPFLIAAALVVWVRGLGSFRQIRQKGSPAVSGEGLGEDRKTPLSPDVLARVRPLSSYQEWGRNPFELAAEKSQGSILSGILWDRGNPQAVINGEIVDRGAKAGLYTVVDIQSDRVILNDGAEDFEIILGGGRE